MFTSLENLKNAIEYTTINKELKHNKHGKCYNYTIELKHNNKKEVFSFTDSIYNYQHGMAFDILDLINCLLLDMYAYNDNETLKDFACCFGYNIDTFEDRQKTSKIMLACRQNSIKLKKLFNNKELNMLDVLFQEY
jgi:hypothetical protein